MATVTIKAIRRQYILSNDDYIWLLEHRNEPLQLAFVSWDAIGSIDHFTVRRNERSIITVFPAPNRVEYEVNYNA